MLNKVATMVLVLAQAAKTVGSFFSRHLLGCSVARTGRSKAAQGRDQESRRVKTSVRCKLMNHGTCLVGVD
jgi:hypothetical protein